MAMFKYMKAATLDPKKDIAKLRFPVWASPKIDGFRASVQSGMCLTSSLVKFPNVHLNTVFNKAALNGIDGELVSGPSYGHDVYTRTSSAVTRQLGEPELSLYVFDYVPNDMHLSDPYKMRYSRLQALVNSVRRAAPVFLVEQKLLSNAAELDLYLAAQLDQGYEGAMLRGFTSLYKQGRSTMRDQYLVKVKPFVDSEAVILDIEEGMTNTNEEGNRAGKRRSLKAGMVPKGTLGKFVVRDIHSLQEFKVGTGTMKHMDAQKLWDGRKTKKGRLQGRIIKYKYQAIGVVNAPRQPIFLGFREPFDM